jgi:hypothetical protein
MKSLSEILQRLRARKTGARAQVHFANIGEGTRESGHISLLGDATSNSGAGPLTTSRYLLVKFSTDGNHFTNCGSGDTPLGIAQDVWDANNTDVPVNIAICGAAPGTQRVVTDGTVTNGAPVMCGANGQATLATTGSAGIFGRACFSSDTTANAGDIITVVTCPPFKYAF